MRLTTVDKSYIIRNCTIGHESGCWMWRGSTQRGYPRINRRHGNKTKQEAAHRKSYELWNEHPGSKFVCHSCDTPLCVNPRHLFLSDNVGNITDAFLKGRLKGAIQGIIGIQIRPLFAPGKKQIPGRYHISGVRRAATLSGLTFEEYQTRIAQGQKKCTTCKKWKPVAGFCRDASRRDGIGYRCSDCK